MLTSIKFNNILVLMCILVNIQAYTINMTSNTLLNDPWLEVNYISISDQFWVSGSSKQSFMNPVIFISLPPQDGLTTTGVQIVPRLKNVINTNGFISFQIRIYQPNDSYCSTAYHTPTTFATSPIEVMYMVSERGAYNMSSYYFIVDKSEIARTDASINTYNFYKVNYPFGCGSSTTTCRFLSTTTVGIIQQLQTLVYNRFLTIRAKIVQRTSSTFLLVPHDALDTNYYIMTTPEMFAYMAFDTGMSMQCSELLAFNTVYATTSSSVVANPITYAFTYTYTPGVFGAIITTNSATDSTSLRSSYLTTSSSYYILQEDQCVDAEQDHTTSEIVSILVVGKRYLYSSNVCGVTYYTPTLVPSTPPTVIPSRSPSLPPSRIPSRTPSSPSSVPTNVPSLLPTSRPTFSPTLNPTNCPTLVPTSAPSVIPTALPIKNPTSTPSALPSLDPTKTPTSQPSSVPSSYPSMQPSATPSNGPTFEPSKLPSEIPTSSPTTKPSSSPSDIPSANPSVSPTAEPFKTPSKMPTVLPTKMPSSLPSSGPSMNPSVFPTATPSIIPTSEPSEMPSEIPTVFPTILPSYYPSDMPTPEPSDAPTAEPTFIPTTAPSSIPSADPTSVPIQWPTVEPSMLPSATPSERPTVSPTHTPTSPPSLKPTSIPTALPSRPPTSIPSSAPSVQPTCIPSSAPSSAPTSSPTRVPTSIPTDIPSISPSELPTRMPSIQPSGFPSAVPSFSPSASPTRMPSNTPSRNPTCRPSNAPTTRPSVSPTSLPTHQNINFRIYEDGAVPIMNQINDADVHVSYYEVLWNLQYVNSTKFDYWNIFLFQLDKLNFLDHQPITLFASKIGVKCSYCSAAEANLVNTTYSCADPTKLQVIWNGLVDRTASTISCDGVDWKTNICTVDSIDIVKLCVACSDPCTKDTMFSSVTVPSLTSWTGSGGYADYFGFQVKSSLELWPKWTQSCIVNSDGNIAVEYDAVGTGLLSCAAFREKDLPLSSTYEIVHSGVTKTVNSTSTTGVITFPNLSSGLYFVFCTSHSLFIYPGISSFNSLNYSDSQKCSAVSEKNDYDIRLSTESSYSIVNDSVVFSIDISNPNNKAFSIRPIILETKSTIDTCAVNISSLSLVYNSLVSPSVIHISSTNNQFYRFIVQIAKAGCYIVSLNISSNSRNITESISDYGVLLPIYDKMSSLPQIEVTKAYFSSDGSQIYLKYSSSTNYHSISYFYTSFPCEILIDFIGVKYSKCIFENDTLLVISLPNAIDGHVVPNVGDNISITGGILKAKCLSSNTEQCASYPYEKQYSIVIQKPDYVAQPYISINAPSMLGSQMNLVIDVLAIANNGGRDWIYFEWTVYDQNNSHCNDIEEYMNKKLIWNRCFPYSENCGVVPRAYFHSGLYTFFLTVQNFLEQKTFGSVSVFVVDDDVPYLIIAGAKYRNIRCDEELLFEAVTLPIASTSLSSYSNVFEWSIYEDNTVLENVKNGRERDTRVFLLKPYSLKPGHQYVLHVTLMTSDGRFASSDVYIYVRYGSIKSVLLPSGYQSIQQNSKLLLNASLSYDQDTGNSDELSFEWSCLDVSTFSQSSCDQFYTYTSSIPVTDVIFVDRVDSIFPTASAYLISVQVYVSGSERYDVSSTYLIVSNAVDGVADIAISWSGVDSFLWSETNTLNAIITSSITDFSCQWSVSGHNINFSKNFTSSGTYSFNFQTPPYVASSGMRLTFTLALQPQFVSSKSFYGKIDILVNSPPRNGYFSVSPLSGSEFDTFQLLSYGWIDDDIPLQYTFFREYSKNVHRVLRHISEDSYASLNLMAPGNPLYDYNVTLSMRVTDYVGCSCNTSNNISVIPHAGANSQNRLSVIANTTKSANMLLDSNSLLSIIHYGEKLYHDSDLFEDCDTDDDTSLQHCSELLLNIFISLQDFISITERSSDTINSVTLSMNQLINLRNINRVSNITALVNISSVLAAALGETTYRDTFTMKSSGEMISIADKISQYLIQHIRSNVSYYDSSIPMDDTYVEYFTMLTLIQECVETIAHKWYDVLEIGQSVNQYLNLTFCNVYIMKMWADEFWNDKLISANIQLPIDINQTSLHMSNSSSIGMVYVSSLLGNVTCTIANMSCIDVTYDAYIEIYISSKDSMQNINTNISYSYVISDTNLYTSIDNAYNTTRSIYISTQIDMYDFYDSCLSNNTDHISIICHRNMTHGNEYLFNNVECLQNSSLMWEITCPLYDYGYACAIDFVESQTNTDTIYITSNSITNSVIVTCHIPSIFTIQSDELSKLPMLPDYNIYSIKRTISGLYRPYYAINPQKDIVPYISPTMVPTSNSKVKSAGTTHSYTSFPAALTLLVLIVVLIFILVTWFVIIGNTIPTTELSPTPNMLDSFSNILPLLSSRSSKKIYSLDN